MNKKRVKRSMAFLSLQSETKKVFFKKLKGYDKTQKDSNYLLIWISQFVVEYPPKKRPSRYLKSERLVVFYIRISSACNKSENCSFLMASAFCLAFASALMM